MESPAVSVIIPLYNCERYVGECLDSLLNQTFQDFEVIVVDDCSSDKSVEVVESFAEKFGGRLTLNKTEKNSGGGGYVPRNVGLKFARGKYIFFVDADDFIVETALEKLFVAAEKIRADVIYTGAYYLCDDSNEIILKHDDEGKNLLEKNLKDIPTLEINNPEKNLHRLLNENGHFRNPWTKFLRRDFLLENNITFPEIISGGDYIWVIHVYCCAKRFLRIPNAFYFYRNYSAESVSRKKRSPKEQTFHWANAFVLWLNALEELASRTELLKKNSDYCYIAANQHFNYCFNHSLEERLNLSDKEIFETLYKGFSENNISSRLTVPLLFGVIDYQQKFLFQAQQRVFKLIEEINRLKGIK